MDNDANRTGSDLRGDTDRAESNNNEVLNPFDERASETVKAIAGFGAVVVLTLVSGAISAVIDHSMGLGLPAATDVGEILTWPARYLLTYGLPTPLWTVPVLVGNLGWALTRGRPVNLFDPNRLQIGGRP